MDDPRTPADVDRLFAKLLEDDLQPAEREELSRSLRDDPAVRLLYRKYMIVDAMLRWEIAPPLMWMGEDSGCGVQGSGFRVQELGCPEPAGPSLDSLAADGEPMIPPIIIRTSPAVDSPLFSTLFAPGGWAFSYAAATVVTGLLLLVLWAWTVSHDRELAGLPPHSTLPAVGPEKPRELVGRIIGTADCRWANPDDIPPAAIRVGRKYELASGLLEISYLSGAKVILQGPCTYEIDSPAGGFLSLGKLTARVEQGSGVRGQSSEHYPLSTSHNPLFSVRTPTAIVSDLGTEFGVEVGKEGVTTSHVFRGAVRVQVAAGYGRRQETVLRESESARVERGESAGGLRLVLPAAVGKTPNFVRSLVEPPKFLDLLDIVAGGDGTGHRRECGIDATTGMQDPAFMADERGGDRQYRPVPYNRLIDGVFVPDGGDGPVQLDSAGHRFDDFGKTLGDTFGSIWARAAEVKADRRAADPKFWIYAMGRGGQFMPEGRGLLGLHANTGITFDLDAMRQAHPGVRPARFRALTGLGNTQGAFPGLIYHGQAALWVFVDGRLSLARRQLHPEVAPMKVDVELAPGDRFLTLVSTSGSSDKESTWVVFGDPVLEMAPQQ